jgi:hypothetical protein
MVCGAAGLCVRVASGRDAGAIDAGSIDAGAIDASGIDASGIDASGIDASGIDASGIDAAADAGPVCRLEVTAVDLYGEAGVEDIAGFHSFGPDNERMALTFTGTLETMGGERRGRPRRSARGGRLPRRALDLGARVERGDGDEPGR